MYIGIDHGTNAIRFASINRDENTDIKKFELSRDYAASMQESDIIDYILNHFDSGREDIELIAVTFSMGDGINSIENIDTVDMRGVKSIEGAGKKTGGGAKVFDAVKNSNISAVVIPGIHTGCNTDQRMNVFSHSTSPEKIGIAYHARCSNQDNDFIVSDISSNTVTVGVSNKKIVGAIDACILAPGLQHGPLDLQAIRDVDSGVCSANEAFMHAGVLKRTLYNDLESLLDAVNKNNSNAILALDTISLFAAMEIKSIQVLLADLNPVPVENIYLAGSVGEIEYVVDRIHHHLGLRPHVLGKWSAAIGCAEIARDICSGKTEILGLDVNF
ncbi:MAG: methanogenesis marker 12 protein [Methanohalobium sp.]|uniref:methanogenesis marker 12 protein n=1 Tax=Methanohalobium sp. TaxID=2837493 RepID=UPI00397DECDB